MRKIDLTNRIINLDAFINYGFYNTDNNLSMKVHLASFPFTAFYILKDKILECHLIDDAFNDDYELVDIVSANGYSKQVNEEYEAITNDIISRCTVKTKSQVERIIEYTTNHYKDELEHLWVKFPDDSIIRKKENQKWYCLFMKVEAQKLGLKENKIYDVIDLRGNEKKINSIDNKIIFPGYHMNKKHWFTLILDERISDNEIYSMIEESYSLAY